MQDTIFRKSKHKNNGVFLSFIFLRYRYNHLYLNRVQQTANDLKFYVVSVMCFTKFRTFSYRLFFLSHTSNTACYNQYSTKKINTIVT